MPHPNEKPIGHHSYDPKRPFYAIKKILFFENAKLIKPPKLNCGGSI